MYLLLLFKSSNRDTYLYHTTVVLMLRIQHRTVLSNFFTKQYFFLNSNPEQYFMYAQIKDLPCLKYCPISVESHLILNLRNKKRIQKKVCHQQRPFTNNSINTTFFKGFVIQDYVKAYSTAK